MTSMSGTAYVCCRLSTAKAAPDSVSDAFPHALMQPVFTKQPKSVSKQLSR
jgi:hypothetical protein